MYAARLSSQSCVVMRCVVTGARGFVGRALVPLLERRGWLVERWDRRVDAGPHARAFDLDCADEDCARWRGWLEGVDAVVHLAARVHQLHERAPDPLALYRRVNRDGCARLAAAAAAAGVGQFVFLSSAKVFGEGGEAPYRAASPPKPRDAYGISKFEAEQLLSQIAAQASMKVAIIRPPLVYGPGVRGNFERLQRLAASNWPLPLASVRNRRDMIGVDNLVDLIFFALAHPLQSGAILLGSDGAPYSLADVIANLRMVQGKKKKLFRFPPALLESAARALLGAPTADRLFGNFELDIAETRALGWSPRFAMDATLRRSVREND